MPYLSNDDFAKVRAAVAALATVSDLHSPEEDKAGAAIAILDSAAKAAGVAYVVNGTHWSVPGTPTSVHMDAASADAAAQALVDVLVADLCAIPEVDTGRIDQDAHWETTLRHAQIARVAYLTGDTFDEIEEQADEEVGATGDDSWLYEQAEFDVWIEMSTVGEVAAKVEG